MKTAAFSAMTMLAGLASGYAMPEMTLINSAGLVFLLLLGSFFAGLCIQEDF